MFRIGICDDDGCFLNQMKSFCEGFFKKNTYDYEILSFSNASELMEYEGEVIQLLFLDVELPDGNGIHMLSDLCGNKRIWRIVYATNYKDLIGMAFSIKTIGFMEKPVSKQRAFHYIEVVLQEWLANEIIAFDDKDSGKSVRLEDIVYIKSMSNYIGVYGENNQFILDAYGTLKYWEKKLEKYPFIRIHKMYMVNLLHVQKISGKVYLRKQDSEKQDYLPLGRQYKNAAGEQFEKYCIASVRRRL